ncbi:hypothetical protein [Arthrobacter rhombi]|uniref:hypothetical protein n=1 Tax=Arthrobacter rhombi TaxID=71253 RepID=UPI003FD47E04
MRLSAFLTFLVPAACGAHFAYVYYGWWTTPIPLVLVGLVVRERSLQTVDEDEWNYASIHR